MHVGRAQIINIAIFTLSQCFHSRDTNEQISLKMFIDNF